MELCSKPGIPIARLRAPKLLWHSWVSKWTQNCRSKKRSLVTGIDYKGAAPQDQTQQGFQIGHAVVGLLNTSLEWDQYDVKLTPPSMLSQSYQMLGPFRQERGSKWLVRIMEGRPHHNKGVAINTMQQAGINMQGSFTNFY